ncbi:MAG: hypothetical protein CUN52_02715 [Phototrophicales bacterium]|nr:MAG: hypothetical protein CUN52_02715 [Phototrophicales bacterium]
MIKRLSLLIMIGVMFCISPIRADDESVLWVDVESPVGEISPYVYGANYGLLNVIPFDLYPAAEASGIRYLRFPGGRVGDTTNIQNFQIDQFIALCRQIGAEPSISVRLEGGTPEQAAKMVEYVNITKNYGVKYWSIGNEPNLFNDYTTEQHNRDWRAIAQAMLAIDPTIMFVGPDTSQFTGIDSYEGIARAHEFLREFLRANGDMIDIVSVHRYPFPQNNQRATIETLRQDIYTWDSIVTNLRQVVNEEVGEALPIAITEANSDWSANIGTEATPDSFYNAIWWSAVLSKLIQHQVSIVAYFNMQTSDQLGGHGLLARYNVRPTYYVYQLYQKLGTTLLQSGNDTPLDIIITSALREDGAITIIITNVTDNLLTRPLELVNTNANLTDGEYWLFDQNHRAEALAWSDGVQNGVVTLPPQSITLLIVYP